MRGLGLRAGLALNPDTPFEAVGRTSASVDLVLCMTVFPGFGGQSFMAEVMEQGGAGACRPSTRARWRSTSRSTAASTPTRPRWRPRAGANVFVAGSAIFGHERPWEAAEAIRAAVGARRMSRRRPHDAAGR